MLVSIKRLSINQWKLKISCTFLNFKFLYTFNFILNFYNIYIAFARFEINFYHVNIWIRVWLMLSILSRYIWYLRNMTSWLHKFHTRRSTVSIKNDLETKKFRFISSKCIFWFIGNRDMLEILNGLKNYWPLIDEVLQCTKLNFKSETLTCFQHFTWKHKNHRRKF